MATKHTFKASDKIFINQSLSITTADLGKPGALFVVIVYNNSYFQRNSEGRFISWNKKVRDLLPVAEKQSLSGTELISAVENLTGLTGEFLIFSAYSTDQHLVFSSKPFSFVVN